MFKNSSEALDYLKEGHTRFLRGEFTMLNNVHAKMRRLAEDGQAPIVSILACGDSREPENILMDLGPGCAFTVGKNPGNYVTNASIKKVKFAAHEFPSMRVCLIAGHTKCAAIKMIVQEVISGREPVGLLKYVYNGVKPFILQNIGRLTKEQLIYEVTCENVKAQINRLRTIRLLEEKNILVAGAVFDIAVDEVGTKWFV